MVDEPRQREAQRVRVVESVDGQIPSFAERLVYTPGDPRMRAIDIVAYHHRMHDREDAGATIIILLQLIVVRKQTRYAGRVLLEHGRNIQGEQSVEIAALQHSLQCLTQR